MSKKGNEKKNNSSANINNPLMRLWDFISEPPYSIYTIIILSLIVYIQVGWFGFSGFDDKAIVRNISDAGGFRTITNFLSYDAVMSKEGIEFYRPIQSLSFLIDYAISGKSPSSYHLFNLLLHILTCISVLYLFKALKLDCKIGLLFTLIFAMNPLITHSVAWLPARGDLLIGLFSVLSLLNLIKYLDEKKAKYFILYAFSYLFAVFSKESAILLPIVLIIFIINKRNVQKKQVYLFNIILWVCVSLLYLILRSQVVKVSLPSNQFGLIPFISNLATIPELISKFILPVNLSSIPAFNIFTTLSGIVFIGVIAFLIFRSQQKKLLMLIFSVWYVVFIVTSMFYRHEHGELAYDYLEHRAYLSSIGLIFVFYFLFKKTDIFKLRVFATSAILIFSILSFVRASSYSEPIKFYNKVISAGTKIPLAYFNRGVNLEEINDINGALKDYTTAINLKKDYFDAYNNRGNILLAMNDLANALSDYKSAVKYNPKFSTAFYNMGLVYSKMNDQINAIECFTKSLNIRGKNPAAYNSRGKSKMDIKDYEGALKDYQEALAIDNNYSLAYNNRGILLGTIGNYQQSIAEFEYAIKLDPKFADAWNNLGYAKFLSADTLGACTAWQKGTELGSVTAKKFINLYCK